MATALALFLPGIFMPLMSLHKFYIFSNQVSLASAVWQLFQEGEWLLFMILFGFSILFPLAKLIVLYLIWNRALEKQKLERYLNFLAHYGKWSMLDVFVVAVLVVTIKLGAMAYVEIHFGLYAFTASVILSMLATARIIRLHTTIMNEE
ncbi:MAG: paraquat-inducible protein A [Gammaproteobacteria bacterium]|nr:paraquat-inducible protein A [Gammaproteobacteria bacterium]